MIRKPENLTIEELRRIVRDVNDEMAAFNQNSTDLKGRRITNSGLATNPDDLVPRKQLDAMVASVRRDIAVLSGKKVPTQPQTTTPGAGNLPAPTHPIDFGYWYVDRTRESDPAYGDFYGEVKGYTNMYHSAGRFGYAEPGTPTSVWQQRMGAGMRRAAQDGKNIHWLIGEDTPNMADASYEVCLRAMEMGGVEIIWPKVKTICISDEGITDRAYAEQRAAFLRQKLRDRNLPDPPNGIGLGFFHSQLMTTNAVSATGIDWIGYECYLDAPGDPVSSNNVARLNANIALAKSRIPSTKKISFIMQGYTRNYRPDGVTFNWSNLDTLADIQIPVYLASYNDPRVFDISIFSYGRQTGTRHVDSRGGHLAEKHKMIGAAILGQGGAQFQGCRRLTQGGTFNYPDMIQEAIAINQDLLEITNPGGGFVVRIIPGNENAFVEACIEVFSAPQTGWEFVRHEEDPAFVVGKLRLENDFSETWAIYSSDLRVRTTQNAYIETCRPPQPLFD